MAGARDDDQPLNRPGRHRGALPAAVRLPSRHTGRDGSAWVSERGPERTRPGDVPTAGSGWQSRMDRQAQPTIGEPDASARTRPTARTTGPGELAPSGRAGARARPAGNQRRPRRPSWRAVWGVLVLLLLGAALVAIVLSRPPVDDTTSSDAAGQRTAAPTVSTPAESEAPTAPVTSDPPAPSVPPEPAAPTSAAGSDPLGLGVPVAPPACDGSWEVIVGSATDPASYAADVSALLSANPGAKYALTQGACASLRQQTAEGQQIYMVYTGPYPDQASACAAKLATGTEAYVKRMDDTTPPDQTWTC